MIDSINWASENIQPFGKIKNLDIFFQPGLTWLPGGAEGIALLFIEDTTDSTDIEQQDFREFVKSLLRWTWKTGLGNFNTQVSHEQLTSLYDDFVKNPFSYSSLSSFLGKNFQFRIKVLAAEKNCTIFPMFPELSLKLKGEVEKSIDFTGNKLTQLQFDSIKNSFKDLKVNFSSRSAAGSENPELLSVSKYLFKSYGHLLTKNILQEIIDTALEKTPAFREVAKTRMEELINQMEAGEIEKEEGLAALKKLTDGIVAEEGKIDLTAEQAASGQLKTQADQALQKAESDLATVEAAAEKAVKDAAAADKPKVQAAEALKIADAEKVRDDAQAESDAVTQLEGAISQPLASATSIQQKVKDIRDAYSPGDAIPTSSLTTLRTTISAYISKFDLEELLFYVGLKENNPQEQNPYSNIAGMASRFMMHGLRLPKFDGNTGGQGLYQATNQQFPFAQAFKVTRAFQPAVKNDKGVETKAAVPEDSEYRITLQKPSKPNFFQFERGTNSLDYVIPRFDDPGRENPHWKSIQDYNKEVELPSFERESPALIPWYKDEKLRFALRKHLTWGNKHLLPLPASLLTRLQHVSGTPKIDVKVWPNGKHENATLLGNTVKWVTSIELPIQRISTQDDFLPKTYEFTGITEAEKDLLETIINTSGVTPNQLSILIPTTTADSFETITPGDDFLLNAILYDPNTPHDEIISAGPSSEVDFLKLIWEGSTLTTGGYYLRLENMEPHEDQIFKKGPTASLKLIIEFDNTPISSFHNSVVLPSGTKMQVEDLWLAEFQTETMPVLLIPPGFLGFQVIKKDIPADDSLENLFHLLGYKLQGQTSTGLPVGPTSPDDQSWLYERLVPFAINSNPYSKIKTGADLKIDFWWQDIYGNSLKGKPLKSEPFKLGYTDPLIGINQWPSVVEHFEFKLEGSKPKLFISLAFDPSTYLHPDHNESLDLLDDKTWPEWKKRAEGARTTFKTVSNQLAQPDTSFSVSTSLAFEVKNGKRQGENLTFLLDKNSQFKADLKKFAEDCWAWLETAAPSKYPSFPGHSQEIAISNNTDTSQDGIYIRKEFIFELTVDLTISRELALVHEDLKDGNKINPKYANVWSSRAILTPRLQKPAGSINQSLTLAEFALQHSNNAELLSSVEQFVQTNWETPGILAGGINLSASTLEVETLLFDMMISDWELFAGSNTVIQTQTGDTFDSLHLRFHQEIASARSENIKDVLFTKKDLAGILANVKGLLKSGKNLASPVIIPQPRRVKAGQSLKSVAEDPDYPSLDIPSLVQANQFHADLVQKNVALNPALLNVESNLFTGISASNWQTFQTQKFTLSTSDQTLDGLAGAFDTAMGTDQDFTSDDLSAVLLHEKFIFDDHAILELPSAISYIKAAGGTTIQMLADWSDCDISELVSYNEKRTDLLSGGISIAFPDPGAGFSFTGSLSLADWQTFISKNKGITTWVDESFRALATRIQRQLIATLGKDVSFPVADLGLILANLTDVLKPGVEVALPDGSIHNIKLTGDITLNLVAQVTGFFIHDLVGKNVTYPILKKGLVLTPADLQVEPSLFVSLTPKVWESFAKHIVYTQEETTFETLIKAFEAKMGKVLGKTVTFSLSDLAGILANVPDLLRPDVMINLPHEIPAPSLIQPGDSLKDIALTKTAIDLDTITHAFVQKNAAEPGLLNNDVKIAITNTIEISTKAGDTFEAIRVRAQEGKQDIFSLKQLTDILANQAGLLNIDAPVGSKNLSLKAFARNFENAFEGICLAVSEDKHKKKEKPAETRSSLFAVRIGNDAASSVVVDIKEEIAPFYFGIPPLANTLLSAKVALDTYSRASGLTTATDTTQFNSVDINDLARSFLVAVEDFCAPEHLVPAYQKSSEEVSKILSAKPLLAFHISSTTTHILERRTSGNLAQAQEAIQRELIADLVKGYDIETIVQQKVDVSLPTGVSISNTNSAPRIRGKAKVIKIWRGEGTLIEVDPQEVDFSFSAGEFKVVDQDAFFTYLFDTKTPEKFASLEFMLDFVIAEIEYDIKPMPGFPNHEASNWLNFINPEKLTQSMGRAPVPIPLHNYPMPPSLILQQAEADPTSLTELRDVRQWKYTIVYEHLDIAQDSIDCLMDLNVITPSGIQSRGVESKRTLLEALINFNEVYPTFRKDLQDITPEAIPVFANLVREVTEAWEKWNESRMLNAITVESAMGPDFFHFEVSEEPISETDKQGVITLFNTPASRIGAADPLKPVLELPGYKQKSKTIESVKNNHQVFTFTYEPDEGDLTTYGDSSIPDRKLTIENLDVIEHQNAWAKIWLSRNKNLVYGETTNPDFIFRTPAVRFTNMVTPFITNDEPWDISSLSETPYQDLLTHLGHFIHELFPKPIGINYEVRMSCRYAFPLVEGKGLNVDLKPTLPLLMGLRLNPNEGTKDDPNVNLLEAYPALLDTEIKTWFTTNKPSVAGASIIFSVNLFSKLDEDSTTSLPMLRINRLELKLEDISDLPEVS